MEQGCLIVRFGADGDYANFPLEYAIKHPIRSSYGASAAECLRLVKELGYGL